MKQRREIETVRIDQERMRTASEEAATAAAWEAEAAENRRGDRKAARVAGGGAVAALEEHAAGLRTMAAGMSNRTTSPQ